MPTAELTRDTAFGQQGTSFVDRAGVWLSGHQIRRTVGGFDGKDVGDFGCGFEATFMRTVLAKVKSATLVDVSLSKDLKSSPHVTAIEGTLPGALEALPDQSLDVVLCMSVLEHLWEPAEALTHFRRLLRPGGACAINVPTWRSKRPLEFLAFHTSLAPACEMDDHKTYYDPRDLWPMLVRAGFVPHGIRCFKHKFTMSTFAVCKVDPVETQK
jgi:SAM-dependent methyltransferase